MSKDLSNPAGAKGYAIASLLSVLLFVYVVLGQPGPIDQKATAVAKSFSAEDYQKRYKEWMTPSAEMTDLGKDLYAVNCVFCHAAGGADSVEQKVQSIQRTRPTSVGIYLFVKHGSDKHPRFDFLPIRERHALTQFLLSKSGIKTEPSKSDLEALYAEEL